MTKLCPRCTFGGEPCIFGYLARTNITICINTRIICTRHSPRAAAMRRATIVVTTFSCERSHFWLKLSKPILHVPPCTSHPVRARSWPFRRYEGAIEGEGIRVFVHQHGDRFERHAGNPDDYFASQHHNSRHAVFRGAEKLSKHAGTA